jgi:glycosyltransferase involved in cell wall biosynthesis
MSDTEVRPFTEAPTTYRRRWDDEPLVAPELDPGENDSSTRKKISIITPAYNEAECIDELARRLGAVFDELDQYDFEAIVVENGSEDDTFEHLEAIRTRDPRFKIVQLARNFRMDGGITAGLSVADGDAVVLMTADLQDPPEMIPQFVAQWEAGYENVYGIVTARRGTGLIRRFNSRLFYWGIGKLTGHLIPANASDFRLLDRRVYEQVRSMDERNRFVRGLVAWVGFKSVGVEHERPERFAGTSKAYTGEVMQLAVNAVFAHSQIPLVMIPLVGLGLFLTSLVTMVVLAVNWSVRGVPFPGFGTIVTLMVMLFGILFLFLGIVSLYIGLIYEEVKGRPNFIVRQRRGFGGLLRRTNASSAVSGGEIEIASQSPQFVAIEPGSIESSSNAPNPENGSSPAE